MNADTVVVACGEAGDAQAGFDERVQLVRGDRGVQLGEQPLHQPEVHAADDLTVVRGRFADGQ